MFAQDITGMKHTALQIKQQASRVNTKEAKPSLLPLSSLLLIYPLKGAQTLLLPVLYSSYTPFLVAFRILLLLEVFICHSLP